MKKMRLVLALLFMAMATVGSATAQLIQGEKIIWHKITMTFDGPSASESVVTNPFTNYRLDVTFTHPTTGKSYQVPGYYAADGDAANSSATEGNKWRVHFRPDEQGTWTYSVSFREGPNVALSFHNEGSKGWAPLDETTGSLTILPSNKTKPDFRAPEMGRVVYDGTHTLKYAGNNRNANGFVVDPDQEAKKLSDLIDWAHANDLEFHVTELDYRIKDDNTNLPLEYTRQAQAYQKIVDVLL